MLKHALINKKEALGFILLKNVFIDYIKYIYMSKSHINNKNVVNVIINNTKTKKRSNYKRTYSPNNNETPSFNNTSNLQHEILRQSLNGNPQIGRPQAIDNKFRNPFEDVGFIAEGNNQPEVVSDNPNLYDMYENPMHQALSVNQTPMKASKLTVKSLKNMSMKKFKRLALSHGIDKELLDGLTKHNREEYAQHLYDYLNEDQGNGGGAISFSK